MGYGAGERRGPGHLVDFQGLPSPGSRLVHPNEEEIKQRWQDASQNKQGAPD